MKPFLTNPNTAMPVGYGLSDIELADFYGGVHGNGCTPPYDLPGPKLEDVLTNIQK